jgi:hypothetical protein
MSVQLNKPVWGIVGVGPGNGNAFEAFELLDNQA